MYKQLRAILCVLLALVFDGVHGGGPSDRTGRNTVTLKAFSFLDCGQANNDPVYYNSVTMTPDPMVIPGVLTINGNTGSSVVVNAPVPIHVTMYKIISGFKVYVPCVDNVGSCDFDDLCAILDKIFDPSQPCPPIFVKNDWPCHCPLPAKSYTITDLEIPLNGTVPTGASGTYEVTTTMRYSDGINDSELSCTQMTFTIS